MSFLNFQRVDRQKILLGSLILALGFALGNTVIQLGRSFLSEGARAIGFLDLQNVSLQNTYSLATDLMVVVIPVALAWYARTYLKSATGQKRIGVISTLASAAINYAEDCERRGERELVYHSLDLPEHIARDPSPGNQKLYIASAWLVDELKKMGIKRVAIDEAAKWVASEFQKNTGDLRSSHTASALTDLAADLLRQLGRRGQISLPNNTLDAVSLILSIADWAANQSGDGTGDHTMQRETAMARIAPGSLMASGSSSTANHNKITPEVRLTLLARQAVDFVKDLQKNDKLRMSERDTAMAWLIQKVQQDDISVTREQIGDAISVAFSQVQE